MSLSNRPLKSPLSSSYTTSNNAPNSNFQNIEMIGLGGLNNIKDEQLAPSLEYRENIDRDVVNEQTNDRKKYSTVNNSGNGNGKGSVSKKNSKKYNRQEKQPSQQQRSQRSQEEHQNQNDQKPNFYKKKINNKRVTSPSDQTSPYNTTYPEATITEYLNQKRITQNKVCHVLFCLYMIIVVMLMGIGFFFGGYSTIGTVVNGSGTTPGVCPSYVNEDYTSCVGTCATGVLYLQKICVTSFDSNASSSSTTSTPYNPTFSTQLSEQISILSLKQTYVPLVWGSFISLLIGGLCFLLLICFARLIYLYIALVFAFLLGLAFYLLRSIKDYIGQYSSQSVFYKDGEEMIYFAYIFMGLYLVIFPMVLFGWKKIKIGVRIVYKMNKYFKRMSSVNLFTYLIVFITWGLLCLEIFLLINFYASSDAEILSGTFIYTFPEASLSSVPVLIIHFFGIYWFFTTLICWHKYFISSAMCLWYFEEGSTRIYPVTRGLKRSWHSLGTAAIDALLLGLEWVNFVLYGICRYGGEGAKKRRIRGINNGPNGGSYSDNVATTSDDKNTNDEGMFSSQQGLECCGGDCGIRSCIVNSLYCNVNPLAALSAPLTNLPYKESCQISAVTFSTAVISSQQNESTSPSHDSSHNKKFQSIGTHLHILLILFNCLLFMILNYIILNVTIYSSTNPPPIKSLTLPMVWVFLSSLVLGTLMANMYSCSLDCMIFCFLLEKKNYEMGEQFNRNQIKEVLEGIYEGGDDEDDDDQGEEMFEYEDD